MNRNSIFQETHYQNIPQEKQIESSAWAGSTKNTK